MPTESYLYLSIQLAKFTMKFNMRVVPVITQNIIMQNMNNSDMSTQKIPNLHVCYLDERESKRINVDKSESNVCSIDKN